MKKWVAGVTAMTALVLAGCEAGDVENQTGDEGSVKLGSMFELTGAVSAYGNAEANAVSLAIDEINEEGGIDGKTIELFEYDTKSEDTEAASVATKLATQDGVSAIIGPATSGATKSAIPSVNRAEVPLVSPSATDDTVTIDGNGDVQPFAYRIGFQDSFQGVSLAKFAETELDAQTAIILGDNSSDYATGLSATFKENFSGEVVGEENFTADESDFSAVLTRIKNEDFDVLFVPGYYEQAGLIIKQAREMGIEQPILGPDGFGNDTLIDLAGAGNVSDVYYTSHFSVNSEDPKVQGFIESYEETYGSEPDMFSALAYDAVFVVKQAIEEAGDNAPTAVNDALAELSDFEGITGAFSFDENHNPIKSVTIVELQDGEEVNTTEVSPK
ncbi:ABC transporter substrate-binding protein [Lacticigenium naphthae]|uniref:ABC transporter substrate-binding protein n=1 Tax=Lacticigenium naphthae TaxID=515351 RepID=UPI0004877046|nr:ABC transporter substrate-binding protein [Lacticigenium naphthae]